MRLLIDLRPLDSTSAWRGIGRYTRELALALRRLAPPGWELLGLSWSGRGAALGLDDLIHPGPRRGIGLTDRFLLPRFLRAHRIDLYHATAFPLPAGGARAVTLVLTVHDLLADLRPEAFTLLQRQAFRRVYRSARRAQRVITISATTRGELLRRYRLDPGRVVAIPIGIGAPFQGNPDGPVPPSGLPRPFLLYVGGLDPLKNVPFLLPVLHGVRRVIPGMRLVVVGEEGPRRQALLERARQAGLRGAVLAPGRMADPDLLGAYREAAAFLFPSRYEGFGLPPLEAMAAGCPVVASGGGALSENLDGAAALRDPDDLAGWIDAVLELGRDPAVRETRIAAGRRRAAALTWDATARATLGLYAAAHGERIG